MSEQSSLVGGVLLLAIMTLTGGGCASEDISMIRGVWPYLM